MLLILEAVFLNGFLVFSTLFQYFFELHCFITHKGMESSTVEIQVDVVDPLCGLSEESLKVQLVPEVNLEKEVVYEASVLSDAHHSFLESFSTELQLTQVDEVEEPAVMFIMDSPELTHATEKAAVVDEMLSMDAWKKEPEPVAVTPNLASIANAKISDYILGEQNWVVEVIGEEQGFLHVSDGSGRLWIQPKNVNVFARRDIVSLHVDRKTDHRVNVLDAAMLQKYSLDFSMLDEIEQIESLNAAKAISA